LKGKFRDLTGQRFTRLMVLERVPNHKLWVRWNCKCDCGKETIVYAGHLTKNHTQSCGCLQKERLLESITKHGQSHRKKTRSYQTWENMRARCHNPKHLAYPNYGARGIRVCKRWDSFENFQEDMGERPTGKSLDRINNTKGYSKSNCRWATIKEQSRNKRNNRVLTYNGKSQVATDWAHELGMTVTVMMSRLKRGWSVERIFTQPVKPRKPHAKRT